MSIHDSIASCIMLLEADLVVHLVGGVGCPHPGRCSWAARPRETAHWTAVTVIGNVFRGHAQLAMVQMGLQLSALCNDLPLGLWPPLELMLPPLESVLSFVLLVLFLLCCVIPWLLLPRFLLPLFL
jgi:hypothetical protein